MGLHSWAYKAIPLPQGGASPQLRPYQGRPSGAEVRTPEPHPTPPALDQRPLHPEQDQWVKMEKSLKGWKVPPLPTKLQTIPVPEFKSLLCQGITVKAPLPL